MLKKIKDHWVKTAVPKDSHGKGFPSALLIGAPDDRGVFNVGGRVGAAHGPSAVRKSLGEFMLGMHRSIEKLQVFEGFDVDLGTRIEDAHQNLEAAVIEGLRSRHTPIVLGGGHDFGFPHVKGVSDFFGSTEIILINIDAHLDVRPLAENGNITSGSPFFLALEKGVVLPKNFVEFGIQDHCNDADLLDYVKKKKVAVHELQEIRKKGALKTLGEILRRAKAQKKKVVVSFDVDSVSLAWAPGVSAPQVDGFTGQEFLEMARFCGEHPAVVSVGFFELAPNLDEGQKTARLVATAVHRFLTGLSGRSENGKKSN